ncbi:MAG: DUF2207 domain-containing protein [Hyphomicrobiales bacterium]
MMRTVLPFTPRTVSLPAALLAFVFWIAAAGTALADSHERIVGFDSEIWVQTDASMTVRETITVVSTGNQIKRGIFRDFPTKYRSRRGVWTEVSFDVQGVTRDGQPEAYFTEDRSNGVRVYIGRKSVFLQPGRYVYEITYRTTRQLGFFDGFDELYWNVTGNGWNFDIERATATIHLPDGARVLEHAGYTGITGAKGGDFTYTPLSNTRLRFETTRTLFPGQGLTIAVSWPPGLVTRPTQAEKVQRFFTDNGIEMAGATGIGLLLLYYLAMWSIVGRDLPPGTIIPRYKPPSGVSPAAARFVTRMGFDDKTFSAAIVSLAVKGYLTIKQGIDKVYTLETTGETPELSPGERALAAKLFSSRNDRITLKQANHSELGEARKALKTALQNEHETTHFVRNFGYFVPGLGITALVILGIVMFSEEPIGALFMSIWLSVWSYGVSFLLMRVWTAWRAALGGAGILMFGSAIFITLFALPFIGGLVMGIGFFVATTSLGGAIILLVVAALNMLFFHLLKAPTRLGRQLLDQIEGFKEFLTVAEKDRMNMLNPPERTPELFERYLPYALALGVEQQWSEGFADVVAEAGRDPDGRRGRYRPRWYSGTDFDGNLDSMTNSLSHSLSSAISSASTAPGSSSGSSGGGSSGGGGGGGGGGGW